MEYDSSIKKLKPLCIWEEISFKDRIKFNNYILRQFERKEDDPSFYFFTLLKESSAIKKEYDIYQSDEELKDDYDGSYDYAIFIGHVSVILEPDKNKGKIIYYDSENVVTKSEEIVLKKYGAQTALSSK